MEEKDKTLFKERTFKRNSISISHLVSVLIFVNANIEIISMYLKCKTVWAIRKATNIQQIHWTEYTSYTLHCTVQHAAYIYLYYLFQVLMSRKLTELQAVLLPAPTIPLPSSFRKLRWMLVFVCRLNFVTGIAELISFLRDKTFMYWM